MRMFSRLRVGLGWLLLAGLASPAAHAAAEDYPSKPITIVVPYSAGGEADTFTRALSAQLSQRLKQPVVIENRPGASQIIGASYVAKAAPDGHTLLVASTTSMILNGITRRELPYSPETSFAPVALYFSSPFLLVTPVSLPATQIRDFVALAKAKPNALNYASIGEGSSVHLATELWRGRAGISIAHIPYKGNEPALNDLLAGTVQLKFDSGSQVIRMIRDGRLRALATTAEARLPGLPDVPTLTEAGYPDSSVDIWFGLAAPAGTPPAVIRRLSTEIAAIYADPGFRQRATNSGMVLGDGKPESMAAKIRNDTPKWRRVVQQIGLKPEN